MAPLKRLEKELFDWIVEYNREHGHAPTIRQMVDAMGLKSNSPIQNRLQKLKEKGYIAWEKGRMRTVQILRSFDQGEGVYVLGTIAAGGVVESFTDHEPEFLDVPAKLRKPGNYALRVIGDSMIDAHICPNDIVILRPETDPQKLKPGSIVAARVEGEGVTLKHFYQKGSHVRLMPANPNYQPIEVEDASRVQIQGVLVGVFRDY
ncbi:MAG: transcriptional repressor LexA [Leptolyngbyaceae cyanobacterium HOT.MB2.61]|nr:transcriptional repressor LexA [Leptolyngbyaceae cyanobacterium HOT.MB2.61]